MNKQGVVHWMLNKEHWYTDKRLNRLDLKHKQQTLEPTVKE